MSGFNFKSQICTTREQSQRLLSLGLKKETADMVHFYEREENNDGYFWDIRVIDKWESCWDVTDTEIPAWSLHRLIEMRPKSIILHCPTGETPDTPIEIKVYAQDILGSDPFGDAIRSIEWLIKEGYFNKEYLEE